MSLKTHLDWASLVFHCCFPATASSHKPDILSADWNTISASHEHLQLLKMPFEPSPLLNICGRCVEDCQSCCEILMVGNRAESTHGALQSEAPAVCSEPGASLLGQPASASASPPETGTPKTNTGLENASSDCQKHSSNRQQTTPHLLNRNRNGTTGTEPPRWANKGRAYVIRRKPRCQQRDFLCYSPSNFDIVPVSVAKHAALHYIGLRANMRGFS